MRLLSALTLVFCPLQKSHTNHPLPLQGSHKIPASLFKITEQELTLSTNVNDLQLRSVVEKICSVEHYIWNWKFNYLFLFLSLLLDLLGWRAMRRLQEAQRRRRCWWRWRNSWRTENWRGNRHPQNSHWSEFLPREPDAFHATHTIFYYVIQLDITLTIFSLTFLHNYNSTITRKNKNLIVFVSGTSWLL